LEGLSLDGKIGRVEISGALYPPSFQAQIIAQIAGGLWMAGLALVFAGPQIFRMLGLAEDPEFYKIINEKKMLFLGVLFFLNNIGNSQLATGAFEIYLDDQLVFSKLAAGRTPNQSDMDGLMRLLR
jgi:selT/selW/selH-like putative selenoprotein